ncbi:MAG: ATP-binding protein [Bdellovibrionota bacterium]
MIKDNSSPHILMVEQGEVCADLERVLIDSGVTVITHQDSETALAAAKSENFDLILTDMDICMPNGESFVEALCKISPSKAVIVFGNMAHDEALKIFDMGAVSYFKKPVDLNDLKATILHISTSKKPEQNKIIADPMIEEDRYFELTSAELSKSKLSFETAKLLLKHGLISEGERLRLELAFQEALANAHEHGNLELESIWKEEIDSSGDDRYKQTKIARLEDPKYSSRKIKIWMSYKNGKLCLRIQDGGGGFTDNLLKKSADNVVCYGRGITILHATMDSVEYKRGGSEVILQKIIEANKNHGT